MEAGEDFDQAPKAPKPIKGKDLPGAVNVLPAGLGDVLKKRESREFKMEQKESSMTFSTGGHQQTFAAASAASSNFQESKASSAATASFGQTTTATNFGGSTMMQQNQSSSMMQSSQKSFSSSTTSNSSSMAAATQVKSILKQPKHGEEIQQEALKTQIQSAITDIEQDMSKTDFADKENRAPQQQILQQQQETMLRQEEERHQQMLLQQQQEQQQQQKLMQEEQLRIQQDQQDQLRIQQDEQLRIQQEELRIQQEELRMQQQAMEQATTTTTATQNGHFNASDLKRLHDEQRAYLRTPHEFKARPQSITNLDDLYTPQELDLPDPTTGKKVQTVQQTSQKQEYNMQESMSSSQINGSHSIEESSKQLMLERTIGDGAITLGQVMTPVHEPDSNSLKRRNPKQMFTDSAFYSPKFHPSVADQVEMAHKLSSSLYDHGNKLSKGQEMYLKRAKKSGDTMEIEPEIPQHDKTPNLKLVMNPEGKLHDWTDMPEEEVPEMAQIAMVGNPEIAQTLVSGLNDGKGRGGELFAKRRKKADKWVVDENQIGSGNHPSQFADEFISQQTMVQQQCHQEKELEVKAQQQMRDEADAQQKAEQQEIQQKQQQIFQEQQLMKQQQSVEIKQQQTRKQSLDLPPSFQHCSLKGRPFTPSMDLGIHNVQGIDVWAPKGPKPYGKAGANTCTAPKAQPPTPAPAKPQPEPIPETQDHTTQEIPQLEALSPPKEEPDYQTMKAQMEKHQSSSTKVVKQEQVSQQVTQQQVTLTESAKAQEEALAEKKRKEYEEWLRAQEMEAFRLEYDCSVKYEEHQSEKQEETKQEIVQQTSQLTTNFSEEKRMEQIQQEEFERQEAKRRAQEEAERQEAIRKAQLEAERLEAERQIALKKACEEAERQEAIRKAQQEAERLEAERQMALKRAQEEAERQEAQRLAQEQARKQEQLKPVPPPAVQRDVVDFSQSRQQQSQEVFQQQQTSFQSSQTFQSSLEHNELSMQIKSGGMMHGDERTGPTQQIDDYVGSLRPTTTGEIIRQPAPDAIYTSNRESVYNEGELYSQANLKKNVDRDPRHSGVFAGIAGDHNSLVDNVCYERHTVQNLVKHFSTTKTGDIPVQFLPQQYMQNSAEAPPLSYLKEQAKSKDFSYKEKSEQTATSTSQTSTNKKTSFSAEENAENLKLFQRRGSLKDYLMMDLEDRQQSSDQPSILDPSAILQVDGSIEPGLGQKRAQRDSNGREYDSQGRLMDTDKWDNHNTIARGWLTAGEDHYQPVTFRRIYGTKSVAGPSPLPASTTTPAPQQPVQQAVEPVEQEVAATASTPPQDEGYADL